MRVSGFSGHYKSVLGAGAKAKSVTNNLPLLSVLGNVILISLPYIVAIRLVNLFYSELEVLLYLRYTD
jgi:hypothetical protein